MPSHTHSFTPSGSISMNAHSHSFSWSGTTSANGGWNTYIRKFYSEGNNLTWNRNNFWENVGVGASNATIESTHISSAGSQIGSDNHTHTYSGSGNTANATPTGSFSGTTGTTGTTGSGTAFSILPPYVVKYCFERIS